MAAREVIAVALEAERRAWLDTHAHLTDATGKRLVVGNGYLPGLSGRVPQPERAVTCTRPGRESVPVVQLVLQRCEERFGGGVDAQHTPVRPIERTTRLPAHQVMNAPALY